MWGDIKIKEIGDFMKYEGLTKMFYNVGKTIRQHSPEILTGIGIGGMLTTTVLAVQATPKALEKIKLEKKEKQVDKLGKIEILKKTWKYYIPSLITGCISISCIIGASAVNTKRNAALATAYSLSESALKLYRDKVIETIGEKDEIKIRDAVAKEKINKTPIVSKEVIVTEKGNTLCFDTISGRYFKSDMETIKKAVNAVNHRMLSEMYVSLNDFYDEIGLPSTKIGDDIGWNVNRKMIELSFSSQLATDGTPCLVVDYMEMPIYEYDK